MEVCLKLQSEVNRSTGFSAFFLNHLRDPYLPSDVRGAIKRGTMETIFTLMMKLHIKELGAFLLSKTGEEWAEGALAGSKWMTCLITAC